MISLHNISNYCLLNLGFSWIINQMKKIQIHQQSYHNQETIKKIMKILLENWWKKHSFVLDWNWTKIYPLLGLFDCIPTETLLFMMNFCSWSKFIILQWISIVKFDLEPTKINGFLKRKFSFWEASWLPSLIFE